MSEVIESEKLVSVQRLTRDLAAAATTLTDDEARFLVDAYYLQQENRIRSGNQVRALGESIEPNSVVLWLADQSETLENQVKRALDKYSDAQPLGRWAREIVGIGPVIAAGLLSHIDITVPSAGHVWRFAGLDSTSLWVRTADAEKWIGSQTVDQELLAKAALHFGRSVKTLVRFSTTDKDGNTIPLTKKSLAKAISRRPFNARLKTLCWKIGESFVKVMNNQNDIYGKIYAQRKALEAEKNEKGDYAAQAAALLKARPDHAQASVYKQGKLPPGHLHARAKRYAVKLFLSHYVEAGKTFAGLPIPKPYPIAFGDHIHIIPAPNLPPKKED